MVFLFAHPPQLAPIKDLLARCDLPHEDLDPNNIVHFLTCRTEGTLAGATGMDVLNDVAVLRPPAVAPELRGRGIGSLLLVRIERFAALAGARRFFAPGGVNEDYLLARGYRRISWDELPEAVRRHAVFSDGSDQENGGLVKNLVATKMPAARKAASGH